MMRWAEHVAYMDDTINACTVLVGKFEGNRQLLRPGHRWVGMDRFYLAQDWDQWRALVKMAITLQVP
jgi:hypothetical protein